MVNKGKEFVYCPWCRKELVPDCKCGESIKYENKPYEWKTGLPDYEWRTVSTSHGTNPCSNCQVNPAVNKFASGVCHCALPAMNRW